MANLPHCKNSEHVVVAFYSGTIAAHDVGQTLATKLDSMQCANDPVYNGEGVLLSPWNRPGEGMHLYPDAALVVASNLNLMAAHNPPTPIAIMHTVREVFEVWRVFTPQAAIELGSLIRFALGQGV